MGKYLRTETVLALLLMISLFGERVIASPFSNTVIFQDGDASPDAYGGGYYTSTNTYNGTMKCDGREHGGNGEGIGSVSCTSDSPGLGIVFNDKLAIGTVYRNDGYTEWYVQSILGGPACQINTGPDGYYWNSCD